MRDQIILSILMVFTVFITGCASTGMNASCGHIVASGTYATANANGDGIHCHEGCFGFNCPKPDYGPLMTLTTAYINQSNAVTATIPITVAVTPSAK